MVIEAAARASWLELRVRRATGCWGGPMHPASEPASAWNSDVALPRFTTATKRSNWRIRISAQLADGILRLDVRDPGQNGTVTRRTPNLPQGNGYGLHLVDTLAARWGASRTQGTHVWFELADTTA
jgi:hypothetical protein